MWMVNDNSTVLPSPDTLPSHPNSLGVVVGVTLFFLLAAVVACVIGYKYRGKIRNMVQSGRRRSQRKKEDYSETTQADTHQYTSMIREPSTGHTPIYENLTTRTQRPSENQGRSPSEPEEDLYLQCDLPDEAIYSNDPKCNLAILPSSQEEDVYIMPDS